MAATALVVLSVVVVMVATGLLEPLPKRAILKAGEMDEVTGLEGEWEQTTLHCFEDDETSYEWVRAARSTLHYHNSTADLAMSITVADMGTEGAAEDAYEKAVTGCLGTDHVNLTVGSRGYLEGIGRSEKDACSSSQLYFFKDHYLVEMHFQGTGIDAVTILLIANEQALRL